MKNIPQGKDPRDTDLSDLPFAESIPQPADIWPQPEATDPPQALMNVLPASSADLGEQPDESGQFDGLQSDVGDPELIYARAVRACADASREHFPGGGRWLSTSSLQPVRRRDGAVKRAKVLTPAHIAELEDYIRFCCNCPESALAVFRLTYLAGLRVGEVAPLELDTLRDARGVFLDYVTVFAGTAKNRRTRVIPMHPKIKEALVALVARFPHAKRVAFSCQWHTIKYQNIQALSRYMHYLYREAALQGCSSHSGRRTFATNLHRQGAAMRDIQVLMGHSRIETTQAYLEPSGSMSDAVRNLK